MTGSFWLDLLIFTVYGIISGRLTLFLYHWRNKHEQRRFVMLLNVHFSDAELTYVTAEGTEKQALEALKRKMREGEDQK